MRVREEAETLTYDLNHRGQSSIYEYLYQCIRQDIQTGVLTAGERLPSKRSLARHLNIGVITVANAYEQLLTEGYIRAEEREGLFCSGYLRIQPESGFAGRRLIPPCNLRSGSSLRISKRTASVCSIFLRQPWNPVHAAGKRCHSPMTVC